MIRLITALLLSILTAGIAGAHPPRGIAVSSDGIVYFSTLDRLWQVTPDRRVSLLQRFGEGHVHEIALDNAGVLRGEIATYLPAGDRYRVGIWRRTRDGRLGYEYRPTLSPAAGAGVFHDRRGCTFRADEARRGGPVLLHRRCRGGRDELLLGSPADARDFRSVLLSNIGGAALGADGSFYFRHGSIVHRLRRDDRVVTAVQGAARENFGITVDEAGAVYVVEHGNRRVRRFGPDGRNSIAATAAAPWAPSGVAVRGGVIYLLESTDHRPGAQVRFRVRRIASGGRSTILATV